MPGGCIAGGGSAPYIGQRNSRDPLFCKRVWYQDGSSTLDAPSEGVQYDEGTFVADFEPIWAGIAPDEGEAGALTAMDTPRDGVVQPSRDTGDEDANDGAHVEGTSNLSAREPPAEGLLDVRGQLQSEQLARRELEEQVRRDADAAAWQKEELDQMRERSTKAERRVKALQKELGEKEAELCFG